MWFIEYYKDGVKLTNKDDNYISNAGQCIRVFDNGDRTNSYDVEIKINHNIMKNGTMTVRNYYDFNDDGIIYIKESKIIAINGDKNEY